MRIEILRSLEKKIKSKINNLKIKNNEFSIISNNCWGTFIYKKFGLTYQSPFINLFIFAPDYIYLLNNFSENILKNISFIDKTKSKYKSELIKLDIFEQDYPIGVLDDKVELHFLHYNTKEEALSKWNKRCERINYDKLIIKFSDGDLFEPSMLDDFKKLPFKNKFCFTSQPFKNYKEVIWLEKFKNDSRVRDEWKYFEKHLNIYNYINNLK